MSDEYDVGVWGVWDPIGNPHSPECLCPNCGPTEYALNVQRQAEAEADKRERIAKSQVVSKALYEHRERFDYVRLAEERRFSAISFRMAYGLEVSPEDKAWHDEVLAKMRAAYARTGGES